MAARFFVPPRFHRDVAIGVSISLALHLSFLATLGILEERVEQVIRRVSLKPPPPPGFFVKPPRSSTKAMEFRKVPVPQGYFLRERTQTAQTRASQLQALAALQTDAMLGQMDMADVTPSAVRRGGGLGVRRDAGSVAGGVPGLGLPEPSLQVRAVQGVKDARNQVDMQLDMLSVRHMDTGQHQAMVIQDPNDRRRVKGFLHIAQGYSTHQHGGDLADVALIQMEMLIKALKEYTGIEADYLGAVPLDDPRILEIPWLMVSSVSVRDVGDAELEMMGRYLTGGGFLTMQLSYDSGADETLKRKTGAFDILRRAMATRSLNEGTDWRFVTLQPDHPVYHAYFDFDTSVRYNQMSIHSSYTPLPFDLGMEIGNRLAVFLNAGPSTGTMTFGVGSLGELSTHEVKADPTRALQFALNTIVFALTQEGSVTQQLMTGVR